MGSRVRQWVVIGSALAALVALTVFLSACGGTAESTARSFHEMFQEWKTSRAMSDTMKEEAIDVAEEKELVQELLAGQTVESADATRFFSWDGTTLIGATVTLHLSDPIDMNSVEVPVWLTPGPHPSKRPLPILRAARYTGTGIDELKAIVSMPTKELLELQPFGASVDPPRTHLRVHPRLQANRRTLSMGPTARRRCTALGAPLAAVALLSLGLTACGGTAESTARSFHEAFQEWNRNRGMSEPMKEEAIAAAEEEPAVRKLLTGQTVKSAEATRFLGSDGKTLIGAKVTLHLAHPIELHAAELPVWLTPASPSSKAPLAIHRLVRYSGSGVDQLEVIVSFPGRELLEVQPLGSSVGPPEPTRPSIQGYSYERVGEHGA